jgi:RNA polymerase sigma-70 factor (ECF subfamily)
MPSTSTSLLERLRQPSDQQAWQRFVDLYGPLLLTWAHRLGLSSADAADLVQDVLATLVTKCPQYQRRGDGSFRAWLRTVTRNKWLETLRKKHPLPVGDGRDLQVTPEPDIAEQFWEQEYRDRLVARALEILKTDFQPTTWQAAWGVLAEERPAAEVAAELGLTVGAVHAARFRVLARLRQELAELLED